MGQVEHIDPALELDRRAQREGWTFRCDSRLNFERAELNALRDVWHARTQKKLIPSRADFDARTLKPYLRNITIIERVYTSSSTWRYRARLAGSAIVEVIGDHTGHFLEDYLPREAVPRWCAVYDAALASDHPLRIVTEFVIPQLDYLNGEAFVAPLRDQDGKLSLVFGCIYFKPKIAKG